MGTLKGAVQLLNALWALRNQAGAFPCCPLMHSNGSLSRDRCAADDQMCLYAALRSYKHGRRMPTDELDYRIDSEASLFATVSAWQDTGRMLRYWNDTRGYRRLGYRYRDDPRATAEPCVVHFAGAAKVIIGRVMIDNKMEGPAAWMPWNINFTRFAKYDQEQNRQSKERERGRGAMQRKGQA